MEIENEHLLITRTKRIDNNYDEDLQIIALRRKMLHLMNWAQRFVDRLPVRMTLSNLGILAVFLAVVLPKSLTYILLYPIFRLVFGTLYPAYASYKAVRTQNVKEYVKWMMYWIVFALFTCAETFTDVFFSFWFPFYYEIKIILVLWLLSPATKGSSILYRRFVHPALTRREAEIDEALARATEQGYKAVLHLGTRGVNYATTVLMQTAIKGGGGLVQQLRKSYSLSDLTGGKDVENRSLPESQDETDMEEPRRREHVGRRGYSPRRTQSSTNRVEMYFSEVDVDMIQPRPREPINSLTNIRSSDDISSGYSSGEALQSHRAASQGDALVRTSSVGARTRAKPRSTTKKTPEETGEESEYDDLLLPSPLTFLTPDQAHQLLSLLTPNDDRRKISKFDKNDDELLYGDVKVRESKSSSEESEIWFVPDSTSFETTTSLETDKPRIVPSETDNDSKDRRRSIEIITKPSSREESDLLQRRSDTANEDQSCSDNPRNEDYTGTIFNSTVTDEVDIDKIKDEICREKLDELKELLSNAHKAVTRIVSSEENLNRIVAGKLGQDEPTTRSLENFGKADSLTNVVSSSRTSVTRKMNSNDYDGDDRAGKYNKRPAPRTPILSTDDDEAALSEDGQSQNALKATLVIKTGTVKTFSNVDDSPGKDVFIAHAARTKAPGKRKKRFTKDGIAKLLTIPKNIIHGAFNKTSSGSNKDDDSNPSSVSEYRSSRSRSVSIGSQDIPPNKIDNERNDTDPDEISSDVVDGKVDERFNLKKGANLDKCDRNISSDKREEDSDAKVISIKRITIPQMSRSPGASRKVYSDENIA